MDSQLITQWVEDDPTRPGPANARMVTNGAAVWAIIGYLRVVSGAVEQVARDYGLSQEAVQAAIAYYTRNRAIIDARLAANKAA